VVRWVPSLRGEEVLVSGGVDKCVRVWAEKDGVVGPSRDGGLICSLACGRR
jgi:hypothetical protein